MSESTRPTNSARATRLAVLLFTDIVGSTELKSKIGSSDYAQLLSRHNGIFESSFSEFSDAELVKHTGDGYFAAFATASDAVRFALQFQWQMGTESWNGRPLRARVGIHIGEVVEMDMAGRRDVVGLSADLTARIMSLAAGGQILLTRGAFDDARQFVNDLAGQSLCWVAHGQYLFKGSEEALDVFEVALGGDSPLPRPIDSEKVKRVVPHDQEPTLGWRPAVGLDVPNRPGWKLERKIGEGGFGEVWLAAHAKLKHERRVFKFCFDIERLRSFKRELTLFRLLRDALGDRADIAKLFDVKFDEPPFFLESEYTEGGNLLEWAQRRGSADQIPLAERLEIVAKIAEAVAAAHSIGVLHKDIKPSNILIHEKDGKVQPRLADFGIGIISDRSQLRERAITDTGLTVLTQNDSSRTGTRMYAAPESLLNQPYTVHGDAYALGVLLFQMSIGDLMRPMPADWREPVPDELLAGDIAGCVTGNAERRTSPAELAQRLRTLPERRAQRRQAAEAARLAARRQRRRRWLIAAGSLSTLAIVIAFIAMTKYARDIAAERDRTAVALAASNQLTAFLASTLEAANPEHQSRATLTVREILQQASRAAHESLRSQPAVEAQLRMTIGLALQRLDDPSAAANEFATALKLAEQLPQRNDALLARAQFEYGGLLLEMNDIEKGLPLLERACAALDESAAPRTLPVTIRSEMYRTLASGYAQAGRGKEAAAYLDRSYALVSDPKDGIAKNQAANVLNEMGSAAFADGRLPDARRHFEAGLKFLNEVGTDKLRASSVMDNLGVVQMQLGDLEAAEKTIRDGLEIRKALLPASHRDIGYSLHNLGTVLIVRNRLADAVEALRAAMEIRAQHRELYPVDLAKTHESLAIAEQRNSNFEAAKQHIDAAIKIWSSPKTADAPESAPNIAALQHLRQEIVKAEAKR